jgi:flagellar basal body-associated protein FliL
LSVLIFVALAVAWAAYLIPLALKHHEEDARSRSVERFSQRLRVLARREPVDRGSARLVTPETAKAEAAAEVRVESKVEAKVESKVEVTTDAKTARPAPEKRSTTAPLTPAQLRPRRAAAQRATKRRRNVLAIILAATLVVVVLAAFSVVAWPYVAIPVAVLAAWLVACRLMVKGEQRAFRPARQPSASRMPAEPAPEETEAPARQTEESEVEAVADAPDPLEDTSANIAAVTDPAMWDPVPVTLPTYVTKPPAARRTVHTIDLESTGVWTSGRTEADAQLAREADQADQAARQRRDGDDQRAVGS